jgi:uncharacterized protein with von Willebrand factor type A (vWA) domain
MSGLVVHLAEFARALRARGVRVALGDEVDGATALTLVDVADVAEVRRALLSALKIMPRDRAAFAELFESVWLGRPPARAPRAREQVAIPRPAATRGLTWLPAGPPPEAALGEPGEGATPGYSPAAQLRRKPFDALLPGEVSMMERLVARLTLRLATEPTRRFVPTRGPGRIDLRRSLRQTVGTAGEPLRLARRTRAEEQPRLVLLCDTSGSMDQHTRFLLCFALALRRVVRHLEVFAFNTDLTRLTPWLAPGKISLTLRRLAAGVPDWSGGTRIGASLARFVREFLPSTVNSRTVVVILSDGLDRGEPALLVQAMRAIRRRARSVIWLNPLLGDPRYEPSARGMRAALPYVDRLAAAHNLESLERLLTYLAA